MNYNEMTLAELKAAAKELGIKGVSGMKKDELAKLLSTVKTGQHLTKETEENKEPESKKTNNRKSENKKSGNKKPENRRADNRKLDSKRAEDKNFEDKKSEGKISEDKMPERKRENNNRRPENNRQETLRNQETNTEETGIDKALHNDKTEDGEKRNASVDSSLDSGKEADGILEVMSDGFGFIRCENYLPGENDIYVSPAQIKRFNLKTGDIIVGNQKVKTEREKFAALLYIKTINGYPAEEAVKRKNFEDLTPIFPDERIKLENEHSKTISMRIMDLLAPIGKGQRGMIVAPPKAGKTTLLKQIAVSISRQYRDMHLIVLLIDERPEEVTDIRETIEGPNVEVIYSTFDELPEHHKRVAEMVLERAKRLVEHKEDVVILLDSITRLARAYNLTVPPSGRTLTGGLDPAALHMPKKFFGAARNMREGGSLTVLATALVETGSKMDDVVFEEFKGTGNMELVLDRKLSERRIFPAIDIAKSGTRRDDLLLTPVEKEAVNAMAREMSSSRGEERMEEILKLFLRTKDNREFLDLIKRSLLRR
ncbi:MAG: transcription termination factor Rho [Lachnospiraceae bacterium]|nr:transcription termination factor Rho [Lachnospiraceae bacterium]